MKQKVPTDMFGRLQAISNTPMEQAEENHEAEKAGKIPLIIQEFLSINDSDITTDMGYIKLYRLQKANLMKGNEQLDEWTLQEPMKHHDVGLEHGGGHYCMQLVIYNPDDETKKQKIWQKDFFTLGSNYDKYVRQNKINEAIENNGLMNQVNNQGQQVQNPAIEMLMEQNKMLMQSHLNGNNNSGQPSIMEMMTIMSTMMTTMMNATNGNNGFLEKLALMNLEKKPEDSFAQLTRLTQFQKDMGLSMTNGEKEETTLDKVIEMAPTIAESLAPVLSAFVTKSTVQKQMSSHEEAVHMFRTNPEAHQALLTEMKKHYNMDQLKTISEKTDIPLSLEKPAVQPKAIQGSGFKIT